MNLFCTWCGSNRHNQGSCPKLRARQGITHVYCSHCGANNHTAEHCPRQHWNVQERELERMRKQGTFDGVDLTTE